MSESLKQNPAIRGKSITHPAKVETPTALCPTCHKSAKLKWRGDPINQWQIVGHKNSRKTTCSGGGILIAKVEKGIQIPRPLLEDILEELGDLAGERDWWRNEPRCGYQARHKELLKIIEQVKELLKHDPPHATQE